MVEISFSNYTFSYPDGVEKSASLFGQWMEKAQQAKEKIASLYDEQSDDLVNFVGSVCESANDLIDNEVEQIVGYLFGKGINSSEEDFVSKYEDKYDFDYEDSIDSVIDEYNDICSYAQSLDENRDENSRIFNSTWSGGGFGLKGAISGAAKAGLLNFAQDAVNSLSASAQADEDAQKVAQKIYDFYNDTDTKAVMMDGIYECYKNLYFAFADELLENGILTVDLQLNESEAEKLYTNTMRFSKGDDIITNLCKCVQLYPAKKYLEEIYSKLPENEDSQFQALMSLWNLNFYGLNKEAILKKQEEERKAIEAERAQAELENNKKIEQQKEQDLVNKKAAVAISVISDYFEELFSNEDLIYKKRIKLPNQPEEMAAIMENFKPGDDEIPLLGYDDSASNKGNDGFLLTNKYIYFTNSNLIADAPISKLALGEIKSLEYKKSLLLSSIRFNGSKDGFNVQSLSGKNRPKMLQLLQDALDAMKVV